MQWLIERRGRLRLGRRESPYRFLPARRLIKRFAPSCSDHVYRELERVLLDYHPKDEWESVLDRHECIKRGYCQNYSQPNLYGMAHFFLLTALPPSRLSEFAMRARGVAIEKFTNAFSHCFDQRSQSRSGMVVSPIPRGRLKLVSDCVWLQIIRRYRTERDSDRSWRQVAGNLAESSVETFGRDIGIMAARQPGRFARLALRIPRQTSAYYLCQIMQGLEATSPPDDVTDPELAAWKPARADEVEAVFRHAQNVGHTGLEHSLCRIVRDRPEAGWSTWILDQVCRLAESHADPKAHELVFVKNWEDRTVEDLEMAAINHVRGPAAQAIHSLLLRDLQLLERFRPTIEAVIVDRHPGVRVAAAGICLAVWRINRKLAVDWFVKICECDDDRILPTRNAVQFVKMAQMEFLIRLEAIVVRMVNSDVEEVQQHGAARTTFIWLNSGELPELFEQCLRGSVSHRKGVAMIAAQNATSAEIGGSSRDLLRRMLDDPEQCVRQQALTIFRRVDVPDCSNMQSFVTSYLSSQSFRDDPAEILHSLEDHKQSLIPFREALFAVCESFTNAVTPDSKGVPRQLSYKASRIPGLLLRLYEEAQGKGLRDVQNLCLDVWDRLLESRTAMIHGLIEKLDV